MTIKPQIFQNMLRVYGHHSVQGRRMARYRMLLQQSMAGDMVTLSKESKRKQLVEKIAREIMESLMVSESSNPVVQDVKKELQDEFGFFMEFGYPPLATEIQILRKEGENLQEITGEEKRFMLEKLWRIILNKVNETML
ncbi:MAG TPA: hypothetical protein ENN39_06780 [Desulfonatronum sp.]|nr:hypothetical protein [Desulfonatronum sp.]